MLMFWIHLYEQSFVFKEWSILTLLSTEVVKVFLALITISFLMLNTQWNLRFIPLKEAYRLDPLLDQQYIVEDPSKVEYKKTLIRAGRYAADEMEKHKPPVMVTNLHTLGLMGVKDSEGRVFSDENLGHDQHYVLLTQGMKKEDLLMEFWQGKDLFTWITVAETKEWLSLPTTHGIIKDPIILVLPENSPFNDSASMSTILKDDLPKDYHDQWKTMKDYYQGYEGARKGLIKKGYYQLAFSMVAWLMVLLFSLQLYLERRTKHLAIELTLGYDLFQRHKLFLGFKLAYGGLWLLLLAMSESLTRKHLFISYPKELTGTTNFSTLSTRSFILYVGVFLLLDMLIAIMYLKKEEVHTLQSLEKQM